MKWWSSPLLALVSLATMGCESPREGDPRPIQRDSAGIVIVESRASGLNVAPWVLDTVPTVRVGAVAGDPAYLLSRVAGALRLADGRLVIADGGSNQVRFYDAQGRFLVARGREGEGPGEFEYVRGLGRCREDGFVGFDLNWQMNVYAEDGSFVERKRLVAPDGISPYRVACDGHGHLVLLGWGLDASRGPEIGFHTARAHLVRVADDGSVVTDFGERLVSERWGTTGGSRPHPFGRATVFDLQDDRLYVGSGERFEVEVWDLDGTLRRILRGPELSLAITDSLRTALLDVELARARPGTQPGVRRRIEELEMPQGRPAYTALRVDPLGVVWLRQFAVGRDAPERWSLLHGDRGYLGDLSLPSRRTLLEAGEDYVLVLARDEMDVERVELLRLHRD